MNILSFIPKDLIYFFIVIVLSFLIGIEIKTYRQSRLKNHKHIGSARTYTFIGILGFIFFKINFSLFMLGFFSLTLLYAIHYYQKVKNDNNSIISYLIMSVVYSFGALIYIYQNIWMPAFLFVLTVFILNYKSYAGSIINEINQKEFETLGKFILLSAVILPLLPNKNLSFIDISPFKIWLAVVVISGISYTSYIFQKYFFKNKGYLITGILGGIYSSTATTVVLSKKIKESPSPIIISSIIIATAMMYVRLLVIAFIFNTDIAKSLCIYYLFFAGISAAAAFVYFKKDTASDFTNDQNPLELQTAFLFAFLFVAMMAITKYVTMHFGNMGLQILSFIIGFTDIDPYILSLFTGKYTISQTEILKAVFIATGSNNILKALYSVYFGGKNAKKAFIILLILGIATIFCGIYFF